MNNAEIHKRVQSAKSGLIDKKGWAAPVDILMELGVISKKDYEGWRFGRVPYLEKVCRVNLSKLSAIVHEMRVFARRANLKESWTDYRRYGKGGGDQLRFSISGDDNIERGYATHFVSQETVKSRALRSSDNS